MTAMRLAISNIAWPAADRAQIYGELSKRGVTGVEIAPTKIADWAMINDQKIGAERRLLHDFGLAVSSYQAIYFGKPDLQLLQDEQSFRSLLAHTVKVAEIAASLSGGGTAVFGAPRNRRRGGLSPQEAFEKGAERLWVLAEAIKRFCFVLALESAPAHYGGDFLTTAGECADMVFRVAHPAIRLHLDTGCLSLAGEDAGLLPLKYKSILAHAHASEPDLVSFEAPKAAHKAFASALRTSGYSGWLAIEMREGPDPLAEIFRAVGYVKATYFATK